jgi:hypothetical protein
MSERKLGMELAGFDPSDIFTDAQIEKMRSMKPEMISQYQKSKFGIVAERSDFSISVFNDV